MTCRRQRAFTLVELPVVSKRGRAAFTLVELLVVVSIIALLVTMLMPSLMRGAELARRATCRVNLKEIPRACNIYALDSRYNLGGMVGSLPSSAPASTNANRESLWKLVSLRMLSPESLVCPSVENNRMETFASGKPFAYAFLTMVGRTNPGGLVGPGSREYRKNWPTLGNLHTSTVIIADRNPRFEPDFKTVFGGDDHMNSVSHKTMGNPPKGQNVGRFDESVKWLTIPKTTTGGNSDDWIYISEGGGDGVLRLEDILLLN